MRAGICVARWPSGLDGQLANPYKAAERQRCVPFLTGAKCHTHAIYL